MKAKYIFTSIMMSFMAITDMNAQNNLVVVKNDGSQQTFTLSKKPYMIIKQISAILILTIFPIKASNRVG